MRFKVFKPRCSPEFFRLLYALAKIAFITARITASFDLLKEFFFFFLNPEIPRSCIQPQISLDRLRTLQINTF